jgi:hypothetical protein
LENFGSVSLVLGVVIMVGAAGEAEAKLTVTTPMIQAGSVVSVKDLQNVTLVEGTLGRAKEEDDNGANDD